MSSVISNISFTSLQAYVPSIFNYLLPGDDVSHDISRDVYIIRDISGHIRGSYSPNEQKFVEGLPAWLDPMNQAAIRGYAAVPVYGSVAVSPSYAEPTVSVMDPVAEETISEGIEISTPAEEPELVIAMADSPYAEDEQAPEYVHQEHSLSFEITQDRFGEIEAELEAPLFGIVPDHVAAPDHNDNAADVDPVAALLAEMERDSEAKKSQGDRLLDMMIEAAHKGDLQSFHFSTVSGISAGWSV